MEEIRLNEWESHRTGNYDYMIYWPYSEQFNPDSCSVDVSIRFPDTSKKVGTFVTLRKIGEELKRFKEEGHFCSGLYYPMLNCLVVETVSHDTITRTIDDLLERRIFDDFFEKSE